MPEDATRAVPLVGAIVLNCSGRDDAVRCIESLLANDYPRLRIYVVDNGSTDGLVELMRERYPGVVVIENGANLGWTGGNNAGVRRTLADGCDFVFILNNDVVPAPDCVARLVEAAMQYRHAGAYQPKVYLADEPHIIQATAVEWDERRLRFKEPFWRFPEDGASWESVVPTALPLGAAMFVRRQAFEEGLFDERFFLCWDEMEWAFRARRCGWPALFIRRLMPGTGWERPSRVAQAASSSTTSSSETACFGPRWHSGTGRHCVAQ